VPQATLIYNPLAGPINLAATIELVADGWRARGWQVTVRHTKAAGHAMDLARQAARADHDLVLAAGGDGTLGEVANGLAHTNTVMGLLPVGTANSFARELQLPLPTPWQPNRLLMVSDLLLAGRVQAMDLGFTHGLDVETDQQERRNGRYWLLWTGTGADGFLVDEMEPRPKLYKKLGTVGYALQSLTIAPRYSGMRAEVKVDGRSYSDSFILVLLSNCRLYAGGRINLSPRARLDDGQFEVWLFRGSGVKDVLYHAYQAWRQRHHIAPDVTKVNGRYITVQTDPSMPCQTDGEKAGHTPFTCELKPCALRLLVPRGAPSDLFRYPGEPLPQ
jgi:diacylglycerol kinase (ATP)